MRDIRKEEILTKLCEIYALSGSEGATMRSLAREIGVTQSVLYYYFSDKEEMLKSMFDVVRVNLGRKRKSLSFENPFPELLRERIMFQLDNAASVTAILKYYMEHRASFEKNQLGYIPKNAYTHILEILELGVERGEIYVSDVITDAKVITHAINGFVLEYYPVKINSREKKVLIENIAQFILRALTQSK